MTSAELRLFDRQVFILILVWARILIELLRCLCSD